MSIVSYFIGSCKYVPTTGGHIYNKIIVETLKDMGIDVVLIDIHQIPRFFKIKFFSFLYCFFEYFRCQPNIVFQVIDSSLRYFPFSVFINLVNIPTIQMVHHLKEGLPHVSLREYLNNQLMKYNLRKAKMIIVNSTNTQINVIGCVGERVADRIRIVYPGIECKKRPYVSRKYENKKGWTFISVGAVTPRKGYDYLIEALKGLSDLPFKCYIIGEIFDRKYYSFLKQKIADYKLSDKIEFTGYVKSEELDKWYEICDIFILSSRHEGYGIVIVEALNHYLPVVSTNVGAISEIISHGKTGILVDPQNPNSLTEELRELIQSPEKLTKLVQNVLLSRDSIIRTWDDMKKDLKQVIQTYFK